MKTQNEMLDWLTANLGPRAIAPLSSHDMDALFASVALTPLISWSGAPKAIFQGYQAVVLEMQEHTRHLAYHAIAMELDWSHRSMIWMQAGLSLQPTTKCAYEPGGGGAKREDELNKK